MIERGVVPAITAMMLRNKATSICMWCSISTVKTRGIHLFGAGTPCIFKCGALCTLATGSGAKNSHLRIENLLDIGCGEGYYTAAMQGEVLQCVGGEYAKNAVQVAAKLNPAVTWVVGTGATLPVLETLY